MNCSPRGESALARLRQAIVSNPMTEIEVDTVAQRYEVSRAYALKMVMRLQHEGLLERVQVYRVPRQAAAQEVPA